MQPIISVKDARKILGKDYDTLTDEQIEEAARLLHSIAKQFIEHRTKKIA